MEQLWLRTAQFCDWKAQQADCVTYGGAFERWVFVQAAGVLFEQKAGELLTLPAEQFNLPLVRRLACLHLLAKRWGVSSQVLQQGNGSSKVILYRPALVQTRLNEVSPAMLYGTLGYTNPITPDVFVSEVARRWHERETIPHEIGLALGYPAKDVLGYMGLLPLNCTGCCGWRVYGDPAPSFAMSQACQEATRWAVRFLNQPDRALGPVAAT
jgi:hypothetical protein